MKTWLSVLLLPLALSASQIVGTSSSQAGPILMPQPSSPQANTPDTRAPAGDPGSVEGQVVNAATGAPVKKASIQLQRADPQPGVMFTPGYSTTTDVSGHFAMKDIDPGRYRVNVQRTGFVNMSYGSRGPGRPGTVLTLAPGQKVKDVNFRMTPHAVITGRVLDEDGEPVASVQVQALRNSYIQGKKRLMPGGVATTNDLGEYRMFGLAPGRYYLSATLREMSMPTVDRSANPAPEEGYVPTYYPGSTDPASASLLEVLPGAQMRGMDLALSRARTVRVRGHVVLTSGDKPRNLQLWLMPREGFSFMGMQRPTMPDPSGRFEIRGVAPGSYILSTMFFDGGRNYSTRQRVEVGSNNIDDLAVTIQAAVEVTGQVRVEGQNDAKLSDIRLVLRPHGDELFFGGSADGQVKEDGTFTIPLVSPDVFDIQTYGLPDGLYLKSVRAGENEAIETGIDLTQGSPGAITLVLGSDAGQVEGVVVNGKQQPAQVGTVVLIPSDEKLRKRQELYKTSSTDQYGHYTIKNVAPGEYKLYAWEDVEFGAYMDPDFVKPVEDRGASVSMRSNGKESVQLKLIPADSSSTQSASTH